MSFQQGDRIKKPHTYTHAKVEMICNEYREMFLSVLVDIDTKNPIAKFKYQNYF